MFGAVMAVMGALLGGRLVTNIVVGTMGGVAFGIAMTLAIKKGPGYIPRSMRDGTEDLPVHFWTRPWSHMSDRFITRLLIVSIAGVGVAAFDLLFSDRPLAFRAVLVLPVLWTLLTTVQERRLRRAGG
jgi:hypothetical protein